MSGRNDHDHHMLETLTKSSELVLRKLIRFLVGKISLVKLQEMIRFVYVEEAEKKLRLENPRKNVSLTKLALITGLDTRTLTRTRNHESYRRPLYKESAFLKEFNPAGSILDAWGNISEFLDPATKLPKKLKLKGSTDSFERLFETTIKSRGITQQSLLDRLVLNGAVHYDQEQGTVELIKQTYFPVHSEERLGAFEVGFAAAANLINTIVHNFETSSNNDKFFQRGVWTNRLPIHRRKEIQRALTKILESADSESRHLLEEAEVNSENPDQMTSGVSLFYFEDNVPREEN